MQPSQKRPAAWDLRRLVGSVNQLRFNDKQGEVSFFGQKMIILRRDVFRVMREGLERMVGDQAAPFLSFLASGIGIHEGSIFRDSVETNAEPEKRASLENLVHSAFEDTNLGLGKIRVNKVDFDQGTAHVTITNCFEAIENGPSENPNCMFTSGFLAGLFAEVLDKTVQTNETKCISQGQSECEFQITPTKENAAAEPSEDQASMKESNKPGTPEAVGEKVKGTYTQPQSKDSSGPRPAGEKALTTGSSKETQTSGDGKSNDMEAGVEKASRIAKRKQHFWNKMFK